MVKDHNIFFAKEFHFLVESAVIMNELGCRITRTNILDELAIEQRAMNLRSTCQLPTAERVHNP